MPHLTISIYVCKTVNRKTDRLCVVQMYLLYFIWWNHSERIFWWGY